MERRIVETADGSHSLYVPELNEQYHSRHGALQESRHVFIKMGLDVQKTHANPLRILEIGLGTGLNALLTWESAKNENLQLKYASVEAYPLTWEEARQLNYAALLDEGNWAENWQALHRAAWGKWVDLDSNFQLLKIHDSIEGFQFDEKVDLIYFDAFAPEKQPELWTLAIFEKMYAFLEEDGLLVTYCAKGEVRRTMIAAGFEVEKRPGPPGKREMLVARKKEKGNSPEI